MVEPPPQGEPARRELVAAIQRQYFAGEPPERIAETILAGLVRLTASRRGFVAQLRLRPDGRPWVRVRATSDPSWVGGDRPVGAIDGLEGLLEELLATDAPVARGGGLALPLRVGRRLVGVAGLAGRAGGWDGQAEQLEPVAAAAGQVLWAFEERERQAVVEVELQVVFDCARDAILTLDPRGLIRAANPAAGALFGVPPAALAGEEVATVLPGFDPAAAQQGRVLELVARVAGGAEVPVECSIGQDEARDVVVAVLRDVTERRRAADELLRAKEAAERATRLKSEFLATMSHEVRTPLAGVLGLSTLLLERPDLPGEPRDMVEVVRRSADALLGIVNDILDLSQIEAGRLSISPAPFEPRALVDDVVGLLRPQAAARGLALSARVDQGLPRALLADPLRVRQVLLNLLGNAVKFTERGRVELRATVAGAAVRLEVEDTGPGIAAADVPRLFDRFRRLDDEAGRRAGGTGLGLAICRALVTAMGGEVGVASEPGRGSTFWFTLPLIEPPPDADVVAPASPAPAAARLAGRRVLLAEDNAVNRRVVLSLLAQLGVEARVVGDGHAALAALAEGAVDAVLMDVHMPGLDGLLATAEWRRREAAAGTPRVPILALTASALPEDVRRCRDAGMDEVVAKPVLLPELARVLSAWLR